MEYRAMYRPPDQHDLDGYRIRRLSFFFQLEVQHLSVFDSCLHRRTSYCCFDWLGARDGSVCGYLEFRPEAPVEPNIYRGLRVGGNVFL